MAPRKLTVYKAAEQELVAFENEYGSIVIDCTTPKGMKSAKDCRKEIKDARLNLEDLRKETKAPVLEKGMQIDAEAKVITERLKVLESKFDTAIKAIENKAKIAKQKELDDALAKVSELEAREAAILAKEIELGLREPEEEEADGEDGTAHLNSSPRNKQRLKESIAQLEPDEEQVNTICEPHIKAAAERLHALKKIRSLIEPTDSQPTGDIDEDIARKHDEVLAELWDVVDVYK